MRDSLQKRLEAQVRNEKALKKGHMLEYGQVVKLGAMLYTNAGREVDMDRIKECRRILKQRAGIFSNFRGTLGYVVQIKMALSNDPALYLDDAMAIYGRLKAGRTLPGELLALAATTICDNCPKNKVDEVVDKTREAYAKIKEQHRFLTDESDMALIALMIMAGKEPRHVAAEAERLFDALKGQFRIGSDVAQSVAMVLALSDRSTTRKVEDFVALYEACKEAHHATSKDKSMTIYAAYADLDYNRAELVSQIAEVDEWLRRQKGYGPLGVGGSMRRMLAASFVLEDRRADSAAVVAGAANAVVQAVVEEAVLIIVMIIVTSVVVSASNSSQS